MNRKTILSAWIILIFGVIIGLAIIAVSPVWLIILMIRPSMIKGVSDFIMRNMTKQISGIMFRQIRTPTQPIREMKLCGVLSTGLST